VDLLMANMVRKNSGLEPIWDGRQFPAAAKTLIFVIPNCFSGEEAAFTNFPAP
jgi:hypothetical protein